MKSLAPSTNLCQYVKFWNGTEWIPARWTVWPSSAACKELERFCTRVSRKRQAKKNALLVGNEAPKVPFSTPPNPTSQTFPPTSGPLPPQSQGFGATPHAATQVPPDTQQWNVSQPLSYYRQIHKVGNQERENEETNTPPKVTTATVSEPSTPDRHTRIVSSLPKTEKNIPHPMFDSTNWQDYYSNDICKRVNLVTLQVDRGGGCSAWLENSVTCSKYVGEREELEGAQGDEQTLQE